METTLYDLRHGLRTLVKAPGFTLAAVLTLALGIGATTAIFSVINAVLVRPLPYDEGHRLALIRENDRIRGTRYEYASIPDFRDFQAECRTFERLAAVRNMNTTLTGSGEPRRLSVASVSADYFHVLGVDPLVGRGLMPADDKPGAERVVVLGRALWRDLFAGDPGVAGRSIILDGQPATILGVMPDEARMPGGVEEAWIPLEDSGKGKVRGMHSILVIGRLDRQAGFEQAQAELSSLMTRLEAAYPDDNEGRGAVVTPLLEAYVDDARPALLMLLAAVGLMLAVGCANVANLLLARSESRSREMAIRTALGAGRWRVIRQVLTESMALGLMGGAAGLLLAFWGVDALVKLGPQEVPRLAQAGVDGSTLLFSIAVSIAAAVAFGLAPALRASRMDPQAALMSSGHAGARGPSRWRARRVLVAAETALTVMLIIGAMSLIRSFWNLRHVEPGYDPRGLLSLNLELPPSKYPQPAGWPILSWPRVTAFQDQVLERVLAIPGVRDASFALNSPASGGWGTRVTVAGRPAPPPGRQDEAPYLPVGAGYFRTLGVPLLKGRLLAPSDRDGSPSTVVVNEAFARRYFPGEEPVGRSINIFGHAWEIAGVVGDVRHRGPADAIAPAMYPALAQAPLSQFSLVVRAAGEPLALVPALRAAIWSVDPDLALQGVTDVEASIRGSLAQQRFTMTLLSLFAGAALIMAAVGVYGVTSQLVVARTPEIGVRMALGAAGGSVVSLVLRQGMGPVTLGLGLGLASALGLTRFMARLLFGVADNDAATFATATFVLSAVAFLACYIPARRATKVDPVVALRCE